MPGQRRSADELPHKVSVISRQFRTFAFSILFKLCGRASAWPHFWRFFDPKFCTEARGIKMLPAVTTRRAVAWLLQTTAVPGELHPRVPDRRNPDSKR